MQHQFSASLLNSVGGVIVDSGKFDWTNGKFPELTEPDESYHGISYTESYGKMAYIIKARMQLMRDFGVYPAAHSAFLLNLGLETLPVRMKQYCENALNTLRAAAVLFPLTSRADVLRQPNLWIPLSLHQTRCMLQI